MVISELSKKTGLTKDTIRFYDKLGFFNFSRKDNNYKLYDNDCIEVIEFIKLGKSLGFSLNEIKYYYFEIFSIKPKSKEIKNILTIKSMEIDNKIKELEQIKIKLQEIIKTLNCDD